MRLPKSAKKQSSRRQFVSKAGETKKLWRVCHSAVVSVLALKLLLLHMSGVGISREILVGKDLHNQTSVPGIYGCAPKLNGL